MPWFTEISAHSWGKRSVGFVRGLLFYFLIYFCREHLSAGACAQKGHGRGPHCGNKAGEPAGSGECGERQHLPSAVLACVCRNLCWTRCFRPCSRRAIEAQWGLSGNAFAKRPHVVTLPRWLRQSTCQCRIHRFDPWVGKIPWRRKWQPTPGFLPRKSCGQRSLVGCSPWGHKDSDTTEPLHSLGNLWESLILNVI